MDGSENARSQPEYRPLPQWAWWILVLTPLIWVVTFGGLLYVIMTINKSSEVYDRWTKIASAITIMLSALIAASMVVYNVRRTRIYQQEINRHNRKVTAAFDLYKEYYADQAFVKGRIVLWGVLRKLAECVELRGKWNLLEIAVGVTESKPNGEGSDKSTPHAFRLTADEFSTLNKVYTFYFRLRLLLKADEVDEGIATELFIPNYLIWDQYRDKFYNDTLDPKWKGVVEPITALSSGRTVSLG